MLGRPKDLGDAKPKDASLKAFRAAHEDGPFHSAAELGEVETALERKVQTLG